MIRITRDDFESFKRHKDPEVFTQAQINTWVGSLQDLLVKAEKDELNDIEKADVEKFNEEFSSFIQVEVVGQSRDLLTKSLEYERFFVREKQIEFDPIEKSEDGIEKSRHGKYMDTGLNRKMGRVGVEFGRKKETDDNEDDEFDPKNPHERKQKEEPAKEDEGYGKDDKTEASQHSKKELDEFSDEVKKLGEKKDNNERSDKVYADFLEMKKKGMDNEDIKDELAEKYYKEASPETHQQIQEDILIGIENKKKSK